MKEWDYYTVMERKIRYFSQKYDPLGQLDLEKKVPEALKIAPETKPVPKSKPRNKISAKVGQFVSIFF
ncbi:MAG: hypothetical protein Q8867_02645 [Bacteroidota bacterium]|nr:hypothetical protein [Bacteroidota bacterium]